MKPCKLQNPNARKIVNQAWRHLRVTPAILQVWAKAANKSGLPFDLSKPASAAFACELMKQAAYHESGHVAAAAFTGCEFSHITIVSLIPAVGKGSGHVLSRGTMERYIKIYPPKIALGAGLRYMLGHLAGRAAECRLPISMSKEDICRQEEELEERKIPGTDLFRADKMAALLARRTMPASRIMKLADRWTDEMLDLPPVWQAVETLVALLLTNGKVKQGPKLQEIFEPIMDLSIRLPKWRSRLFGKMITATD